MPLFVCSKCRMLDNTALADYWVNVHLDGQPPLCTACQPGKKWHGEFDRITAAEYRAISNDPDEILHEHPRKDAVAKLHELGKESL